MVENVSNNMSKVKNIEVQPITTCSYKKKECIVGIATTLLPCGGELRRS